MSELVKEYWTVYHYDTCLHGCNYNRWWADDCKCPIGKPYVEKKSFIKRHLFEAYGIPYNPDGIPREKALELLNDWNRHSALAGVEGYRYWQYDDTKTKKLTEVVTQYPARWVSFLEPPQWLTDAIEAKDLKFSIKYEANKERMKQEFEKFGLSMKWVYHEQLEDFIVPLEICSKSPHYADETPKEAPTEMEHGWGDRDWICPECKNRFVLIDDWKNWKREAS